MTRHKNCNSELWPRENGKKYRISFRILTAAAAAADAQLITSSRSANRVHNIAVIIICCYYYYRAQNDTQVVIVIVGGLIEQFFLRNQFGHVLHFILKIWTVRVARCTGYCYSVE